MSDYTAPGGRPPPLVPHPSEWPMSLRYALVGGLLALGAPAGWAILRWAGGAHLSEEISSGLYAYLLVGTTVAFSAFGALLGLVADQLMRANERLEQLSSIDTLTGLSNLRRFRSRLDGEMARVGRTGSVLSLILVDLDEFKSINDAHGHAIGDLALVHCANVLVKSMRQTDEVCRVGGDEFAVLCPDTNAEGARVLAQRALESLSRDPFAPELYVTASFGIAEGGKGGNVGVLHSRADDALYVAKRSGRNRVCVSGADKRPPSDPPAFRDGQARAN